ncbi:MFS transporter [Metallosphaera tengchongensis]|uniref:MFS transporter n=1 Tax=Metallosphaera tengchongensis TaxID=1532350 RepID=A0A6N0NSK0_9CREN|nr:MFS transporter [Metallosphaera tengchongensis]QKQ99681.1 MFS transporter [Metallosphaera tengchongensis]
MRKFLSQPLLVATTTYIGIWYPVTLYAQTKSVFLLGLATTLYNLANGAGSYFWGDLLDRTYRRVEFGVTLPSLLLISSILLNGNLTESLLGYSLAGFSSSLNSPLYSLILLENYSFEEIPKMNSRLSQLTLIGNAAGSISAIFESSYTYPLVLSIFSLPLTLFSISGVTGKPNFDRRLRTKNVKELSEALISFASFNFAAEIFFTAYVPLNYDLKNPKYFIYLSYFILYLIDEGVYYISARIVNGKESFLMYVSLTGRALIVLLTSALLKLRIEPNTSQIPLFVTFGSIYPVFSISFFSYIFRGLKKNRGSIIGIFNAVEDMANIAGSSAVSFFGNDLNLDYLVSFYSFSLSTITLYAFISRRYSTSSSS